MTLTLQHRLPYPSMQCRDGVSELALSGYAIESVDVKVVGLTVNLIILLSCC